MPRNMKKGKKRGTKRAKKTNYMGYASTAVKALTLAKKVYSLVNIEKKELLVNHSYTSLTSASMNAIPLHTLSQGVGNGARVGDSIKVQYLLFEGAMRLGNAPTSLLRVIIFQGKADDGKIYTTGSDLLETVSGNLIYSPKRTDEYYNTRFIMDKTYTFADASPTEIRKFSWKFNIGKHINYTAASTAVKDGGLYIAFVTDQAVAADSPSFAGVSTLVYTDD